MNITISPAAAELIAKFEGFKAKPYKDVVGIPTIGFGSTFYKDGTKVTMNDPAITKETGLELLMSYLNKIVLPTLESVLTVELNQHKIDAIACLMYNIGAGAFSKSTVLKRINNNEPLPSIQQAWMMWNKAGGQEVPGLTNRRTEEFKYYAS